MTEPTRIRRTNTEASSNSPAVLPRGSLPVTQRPATAIRPFVLREVVDRRGVDRRSDPPTHQTTRSVTQPDPRQLMALDETLREFVETEIAKARSDGHASGYSQGRAEALQRNEALAATISLAATEVIEFSSTEKTLAVNSVMELAERIATVVMNRTPHDEGQAALTRIRAVLEQLDDAPFTIAVNADDMDAVASGLNGSDVMVAADHSLQPGEARIRGVWSYSDLTQSAAWDAVRAAMTDRSAPPAQDT